MLKRADLWRRFQAAVLTLALLLMPGATATGAQNATEKAQDAEVRQAIVQGRQWLFNNRMEERYWKPGLYYYNYDNPHAYGATACHILLLNMIGVKKDRRDLAVDFLLKTQKENGDWGTVDANFGGILALKQIDPAKYAEPIRKAEEFIRVSGQSLDDALPTTQIYYAWNDQYDWAKVSQTPSLEAMIEMKNMREVNKWPDWAIDQSLGAAMLNDLRQDKPMTANRLKALRMTGDYLMGQQQIDGCWFSTSAHTNMIGAALYQLSQIETDRYRKKKLDRSVRKAVAYLCYDRQLSNGYVSLFNLSVMDTALVLRAMLESGVDPKDERVQKAAEWLIDMKYPQKGWGFTGETSGHPDPDDGGFIITILKETHPDYVKKVIPFLLGQQDSDGGWAAYSVDLGPFYMKNYEFESKELVNDLPVFFVDPSCPDITTHVLTGLGKNGYTMDDPHVKKAEDYLKAVQFEDGKWYAHWWNCYINSTASALLGMEDVHADMNQPYLRKAFKWLVDKQNPDGGWGENYLSVRDPEKAGIGKSDPTRTALALTGIMAGGEKPSSKRVQDAVKYILKTQRENGKWLDQNQLIQYGDPYTDPVLPTAFCVNALGQYLQRSGKPLPEENQQNRESLYFWGGIGIMFTASSLIAYGYILRRRKKEAA